MNGRNRRGLLCWWTVALAPALALAQLVPAGDAFELTETRGVVERPRVAYAVDGSFLAAWHFCDVANDGRNCERQVMARRFDASGSPLGGEFPVDQGATDSSQIERIASSSEGTFLVVVSRETRFGRGVFSQALASDGSSLGSEVALRIPERGETLASDSGHGVGLTATPDGGFLVIWDMSTPDVSRIEAQRVSATGEPLNQRLKLNELDLGVYTSASAAFTPQGDLVATWVRVSFVSGGFRFFVEGRRFDGEGEPLSGDLVLDQIQPARAKLLPQVAGLDGGGFAVIWVEQVADPIVLGRQFDRKNRPVGGRLQLSAPGGLPAGPWLAHQGGGRAIAIWDSVSAGGQGGLDVRGRVLERRGRLSGEETPLSPENALSYYEASVAVASEGLALVAWVEEGGDPLQRGAFGRLVNIRAPVPVWPARPTRLGASADSSTEAQLTWIDNSDDEQAFEIEARGAGSPWLSAATVEAGVEGAAIGGLEPGVRYKFRVRAVNGAGPSNWSNRARATLPEP